MEKWGLIRPVKGADGGSYAFADLTLIRQADEALAEGVSFRSLLRNLIASRSGQLAFDFRLDAQPAKVLQLKRREPPPMVALMDPVAQPQSSDAEEFFMAASILDDGAPDNFDEASVAYRRALEVDP